MAHIIGPTHGKKDSSSLDLDCGGFQKNEEGNDGDPMILIPVRLMSTH